VSACKRKGERGERREEREREKREYEMVVDIEYDIE
jgi:hypothetical protein